MIFLVGVFAFFLGFYFLFVSVEYYQLFKNGIHTTATVSKIEKEVKYDEDGTEIVSYSLHLVLPNYHGWELGKKYEKTINPKKYEIGQSVDIIQNKNFPTEFVIKKELNFLETPRNYFLVGLILLLFSYVSCYKIS